VAERRSVAADVVGSKPTSRPKTPSKKRVLVSNAYWYGFAIGAGGVLGLALTALMTVMVIRKKRVN
jgi:hypothetical protein